MKHNYIKSMLAAMLLLCSTVTSAQDFREDGISYSIFNATAKTVMVTGSGNFGKYSGDVVIPDKVTYDGTSYSVTAIRMYAFQDCTDLTSVTIPNSVTSIGGSAFENCSGLTSIVIPNSVTGIGLNAFNGCSGLTSITINSGNRVYDSREGCNAIIETATNTLIVGCNNTIIPGSVTSIGYNALSGCSGLTSVTIPNSVTSIGNNAFYGCSGLTSVTIPNSVTSIGGSAFENCSGLTSVTIPNSVTSIGDGAFRGCSGLTSVTIPNSVTSIGDGAFSGCSRLTSIEIPNSVTSIGERAFSGCTGLTSVAIGNSVTSIGERAFNATPWYNNQPDGVVYAGKVFYSYKGTMPANTSIAIEDGTLGIAGGAFSDCSGLTSIVIPNSVTSIGERAFSGCSGLTSVAIGNSVTSIGWHAFYGCSSIRNVYNCSSLNIVKGGTDNGNIAEHADYVTNNVEIVGDHVFEKNENGSLQFTTADGLPGTVTGSNHIWESPVIKDPTSGVRIRVLATNVSDSYRGYPIVALGELEFYDGNGNKIAYSASNVTTNSLESTEGSLAGLCDGDYSTYYHSTWWNGTAPDDYVYLDIKFPQTVDAFKIKMVGRNTQRCVPTEIQVTTYGDYSIVSEFFNGTELVLPDGINGFKYTVRGGEFQNNTTITSVTIGSGVVGIGPNAFDGCINLKTVTNKSNLDIVAGSENHGRVAFYADKVINIYGRINDCLFKMESDGNCTLMGYVGAGGTVTLPGTYEGKSYTIAADVFKNNTAITGVIISEGVTAIPESIFEGCNNLTSLVIPNSLTSIGNKAFNGTNLHRLEINTTTVGGIFNGCTSLKEIVFGEGVKTIEDNSFTGCTGLTSVTVGINVNYIGQHSFKDSKVAKVFWLTNIPPTNYELLNGMINYVSNEQYTMLNNVQVSKFLSTMFEIDGIVYVPLALTATNRTCGIVDFRVCDGIENIVARDTVTYSNVKLAVTDIMPYSFWENDTVTTVSLKNSGFIGTSAFEGCGKISEITIPTSITSIGNYAFRNCTKLTDAVIADSINKKLPLGAKIFDNSALDSLYIGCKIEYINEPSETASPFSSNKTLRTVVITDAESDIYDYEFFDCSNLRSIVVGDGVEDIGRWAFSKCVNLEKFAFGSNVSTIGEEAFSDCERVTNITSRAILPPVCGSQALDDINKFGCTLIVPEKYLNAYTTADQWESFFFIEKLISDDRILTFEIDGEVYKMLLVTPGKTIIPPYVEDKNGISITWRNLKDYPTMPDADITIYGSFGLPGDVNGDAVVNVSDFAALANIILEISPETDSADVNGDAVVNVSDFAALANIILNTSASNAAPKKAAATTRSSVESSLTIEPFSICPGEEVEVEVLMENPGVEISQIEFELTLPTGIEIVYDEENECDMVDVGSRTTYKNHTVATNKLGDNTTKIMCTSQKNKTFKNESGDVLIIVVRATDAFTAANAEFSITNAVLGLPDGETYLTPADYTGVISNTTGIDGIEAEEGTTVIYDLCGCKVAEPVKGGIYIINGKKVVVE